MPETLQNLLAHQADRRASRQQRQVETAKLVTTFSASVAAAIVAAALQTDPASAPLDILAAVLLATAFVAVLIVIILDRTTEVKQEDLVHDCRLAGLTDEQIATELVIQTHASVRNNDSIVTQVKMASLIQVLLAGVAGLLAALPLLV